MGSWNDLQNKTDVVLDGLSSESLPKCVRAQVGNCNTLGGGKDGQAFKSIPDHRHVIVNREEGSALRRVMETEVTHPLTSDSLLALVEEVNLQGALGPLDKPEDEVPERTLGWHDAKEEFP